MLAILIMFQIAATSTVASECSTKKKIINFYPQAVAVWVITFEDGTETIYNYKPMLYSYGCAD